MQGKKYYYNYNTERYISLQEYNRLAKQANRKGILTQQYIEQKGWTKMWGNLKKFREVMQLVTDISVGKVYMLNNLIQKLNQANEEYYQNKEYVNHV